VCICEHLCALLKSSRHLLEIGSGTGQHAVYMGLRLPHLTWQTSDLAANLENLRTMLDLDGPENVQQPLELDVSSHPWPVSACDVVYSANSVHIMSWLDVENLFKGVGKILAEEGFLCLYGPYKYNGEFTTQSNQRFDLWLRQNDSASGIRDFEAVDGLAQNNGLILQEDFAMPANNQLLIWQRKIYGQKQN